MTTNESIEKAITQAQEKIQKERLKIANSEEKIKDWEYHIDQILKPRLATTEPQEIST